jgi:DNA-binding winged helix-turn-helix (wHTH) protein
MATESTGAAPVMAAVELREKAPEQFPELNGDFSQLEGVLSPEEKATVKQIAPMKDASDISLRRGMGHAISFGSFQLFPRQFLLLRDGKPIRIGSRALEMLIALVEKSGDLVSKEDLMARVWPNTFVEPANLTVQVASIRRALGDGRGGNRFLINIPGRGYRFVAPVKVSA